MVDGARKNEINGEEFNLNLTAPDVTQAEEEDPPPLWPLRRWRLVGGEGAATDAVEVEGAAGLSGVAALVEGAPADEPPLAADSVLQGETKLLLGELNVEDDEALLLGVDGPRFLRLRRLLASSMWAALKRSSARARSVKKQSSQKRLAGKTCTSN